MFVTCSNMLYMFVLKACVLCEKQVGQYFKEEHRIVSSMKVT